MNSAEQKAGEKQVSEVLIVPLLLLGMTKHSTLTKAAFEAMLNELRQKLAYMSKDNLIQLRERIEAHPAGPEKDRFPKAITILPWARAIQPPSDVGPSPLIRKVMSSPLGREALAKGWAPELLAHVKAVREWPGNWTVTKIKESADRAIGRLGDIELRMSRSEDVGADDLRWRDERMAQIRRCQDIAEMALSEVGA